MRHPSLISLSRDHHHGLRLALRCRKVALGQARPPGVGGMNEAAAEARAFFADSLERHFRAEEEALFPLMRFSVAESHTLIEELVKEHEKIRAVVATIAAGQGLSRSLFDLGDLLERHIRREERELFPLFEERVSAPEAERLQETIEKILKGG